MGRARNYVLGVRLGRREREVLQYTRATTDQDGAPPSYGMIGKELGIRTAGEVRQIVVRLERKGFVRREGDGRERRIRLERV